MTTARIAYTTASPAPRGNNRETAARMAAAARVAREAAAADARAVAAYFGHIVAVEIDDDYGRFWSRFDARTSREAAGEAGRYIARASREGILSDIDCSGDCPCEYATRAVGA